MLAMTREFYPLTVPTYDRGCRCPECRKSHWHIGRFSAECAFCGFVMQLEEANRG